MKISEKLIQSMIKRVVGLYYEKILYADFTDDEYMVLKVGNEGWRDITAHSETTKLTEWFHWFAGSALCHKDDREKLMEFADATYLPSLFQENGNAPVQIVYRRKLHADDEEYHAIKMELVPDMDERRHQVGMIFVRDIIDENAGLNSRMEMLKQRSMPVESSSEKKILIVDDDERARHLLVALLSDDYEILEAENGQQALDILDKKYQDISLILLDVMMPVMDGYEFMKRFNENELISTIPVVITTSDDRFGEESVCLELGAIDFIFKPYVANIVKNRVHSIVMLRESVVTLADVERDGLTGMYNKQAFLHYAREIVQNNPGKNYMVVIADVENFKLLNNAYGEDKGDQILVFLSACFQEMVSNGLAARYGGDQFVLLMDDSVRVTMSYIEAYSNEISRQAAVPNLIIKYGICREVGTKLEVATACERALIALNQVKNNYTRKIAEYDDELGRRMLRNQELEDSLDDAIANEEFEVWYQPKFSSWSEEITGAEALVRWRGKDGKLIPPGEFIPLFEHNGMIRKLDEYVFRKVCRHQKEFLDKGKKLLPISINLSRVSMYHTGIVETYVNITREEGISPSMVPIEITESAAMDSRVVKEVATALYKEGFPIHMDDFGSGYSSLASLNVLHYDIIKLDKSLIDYIGNTNGDLVLKHTIALAREMGMQLVAEGVETQEQLDFLKEQRCDSIQGYYFSPPIPQAKFDVLIA